jgi:hypothetical protein
MPFFEEMDMNDPRSVMRLMLIALFLADGMRRRHKMRQSPPSARCPKISTARWSRSRRKRCTSW